MFLAVCCALLIHVADAKRPTVPAAHAAHVKRLANLTSPVSCPCSDVSLCRPQYKPTGAFARDKEVFGFVGDGGAAHAGYDWSVVSTVAWGTDPTLMCEAHKHGTQNTAIAYMHC